MIKDVSGASGQEKRVKSRKDNDFNKASGKQVTER